MKKLNKALLISSLLIGSLAVSPSVLAESHTKAGMKKEATKVLVPAKPVVSKEQDKANKKAIVTKAKSQTDLLKEVNKDVAEGFKDVIEATKLIKEDKIKEAIKKLQAATGKFDIALAANPDLGLIPVAGSVVVSELITTPQSVKEQVSLAKDFLDDSKVQAARAILAPLQDDMVTRTTLLPMTTYPDAIKLATKMLVDGKKDAAIATLATAMSTFVEEVSVVPLSLIRAEAMIVAASELDKEKEKDKALLLLDAAQQQLEVATALGYTTKDTDLYEGLKDQIKALKKEITGGNVVEKLYSKLKKSFANLIHKKSEKKSDK